MHLKKITIAGFKSFADRISLSFDRGVTGIIGPNGSGKSNVIDSVRWVMGEQNAKFLRGESAMDIIFAGSEKRKAAGMAEVAIAFDNTDDQANCPPEYRHEPEIVLSRRLYTSGEREYFINKKPCRLKDILNFFAMTGTGGRSYAMIQQGQVERILNAKPEDVREILEEAAGTLVYKARRAEAEKRLSETQLNLSRVDDILAEVGRQQEALRDQVQKAQKWQELTADLRKQELSLLAHNYLHFTEQHAKLDADLASETTKEVEFIAALAHYEARHEELQQLLSEADPDISALQESIVGTRERIARAESGLMNATSRIDQGHKRLAEWNRETGEDNDNLKQLETQVDEASAELAIARSEAVKLKDLIEAFQDEVDAVDESTQVYHNRLEEFEDELKNLHRVLESNTVRCDSVRRDLAKTRKERDLEAERLRQLEADRNEAKGRVAEAEQEVTAQRAGLELEIGEKHRREAAVAGRYATLKDLEGQRDDAKARYFELKAKLSSLEELEATASDVGEALQKMCAGDDEAKRLVKGLLTDFIALGASSAELSPKAVSAFERWAERFVVNGLDDLNGLVRLAPKHGLSAVPVSILSLWQDFDRAAASRWADTFDAEPLASHLQIAKPLPHLEALLARLYYLPALQLAAEEIAGIPSGLVVFTAQGVTFAPSDDFVVGPRAARGILSRRTELEEAARQLKATETTLARTQADIDRLLTEQNEDRQIIAEIDEKLTAQNKQTLKLLSELQAAQQQEQHKGELMATSQARLSDLAHVEQTYLDEIAALEKTKVALETERAGVVAEHTAIKEEAESLEERRDEVVRQHQQRKLDLAKSEARETGLQNAFAQAKLQLERLQARVSRRYQDRALLEQDIETATAEQENFRKTIEQAVLEREQHEAALQVKRDQNASLVEEMRVIDNRLKDCRAQQTRVQKLLSDRNMELERIKIALSGVVQQAQEKYQIDVATYEFEREIGFDPDARARSVQRQRAKIESMGPVNLMAIKEYETLNERYDFILAQRDEVVSSIAILQEAIAEIEERSRDKFVATFHTVNEEMGKLFPILFPGGEARLELVNPEDTLTSGVEIMVRLPGKTQQRMNLFSGGEKALTAISLIFALLKTKPTPFCFLDEVDAPLDEANVGRFNKVIEALADQFQFIIITHNRRTMEVLDTLYGVTMQEPGVSKVVGVDMKKDLPPHLQKAFAAKPAAPQRVEA